MNRYHQRGSNLYQPNQKNPFWLSRSKIDLFLECPRCFYLDRRLGLGRPSLPSFSLNSAVDQLLKNEFDLLRREGKPHELMKKYHIKVIPLNHPYLPQWRDDAHRWVGAHVLHQPTNFEISGIVDDIWVDKENKFYIVDYKSTSTSAEISLEDEYKQGYKKQVEVYQWIFRQMGFKVDNTAYFVYANAGKNRPRFDGRLEFEVQIISYEGNDAWVEPTLMKMKECLDSPKIPPSDPDCEYCRYRELIRKKLNDLA